MSNSNKLTRYDMVCQQCGMSNALIEVEPYLIPPYVYFACRNINCVCKYKYYNLPPLDWTKISILTIRGFIERVEREFSEYRSC